MDLREPSFFQHSRPRCWPTEVTPCMMTHGFALDCDEPQCAANQRRSYLLARLRDDLTEGLAQMPHLAGGVGVVSPRVGTAAPRFRRRQYRLIEVTAYATRRGLKSRHDQPQQTCRHLRNVTPDHADAGGAASGRDLFRRHRPEILPGHVAHRHRTFLVRSRSPATSRKGTRFASCVRAPCSRPFSLRRSATGTPARLSASTVARVIGLRIGDTENDGLHRRQPGREGASVVLDQDTGEALQRAEQARDAASPAHALAGLVDVGDVEAFGQVEVDLQRAALPVAPIASRRTNSSFGP